MSSYLLASLVPGGSSFPSDHGISTLLLSPGAVPGAGVTRDHTSHLPEVLLADPQRLIPEAGVPSTPYQTEVVSSRFCSGVLLIPGNLAKNHVFFPKPHGQRLVPRPLLCLAVVKMPLSITDVFVFIPLVTCVLVSPLDLPIVTEARLKPPFTMIMKTPVANSSVMMNSRKQNDRCLVWGWHRC